MKSANRVIKNTGFLYAKMLITIFISLYSTRLILNALGVDDFGIFNLISGVIYMLTFVNGAMIIATQRYLSIYMGAGDMSKLKSVFSSSVILHFIISLLIVIVLEVAGLFMFDGWLNIPHERIGIARIIFHFMVVSTFFTINAVPYDAAINSHENMFFDALLGVLESVLKLGIAIWLVYSDFDKLILYGLMTALLTILIRIIKGIYCTKKYEECQIRFFSNIDMGLLKEMLAFAGWNLFGLSSSVLKSQGIAVLLNLFFGIAVNAAYGIANTVNANIRAFSTNMIRAIMPQITKSEGGGDRERMLRLSVFASKMSFFLLAFLAIPIIIEMPFILKLWLKTVPENAVIFCQLILVISLMYQITVGMLVAITSVGDIKIFQIVVGAIEIFNLPVAYALVKFGLPAYSVFIGLIFLEFISGGLKIFFAKKVAGLAIKEFLLKTLLSSTFTVALATALAFLVQYLLDESFVRLLGVGFVSTLTLLVVGKYIAMTKDENEKIMEMATGIYVNARNKLMKIRNN